ncbi:ComEC/Rec2 family competence protein [Shinella sp. CPCC 101442]|uniref:ComEC/Rec2 family competence protein n=1 Tax=Shinella sp. CPCC 101442 TaxID=2932265 RepID=UPI0021520B78|nr:ComEC/Rec2 family competence protein [Shinella sp. CPCC 101442]MCR6501847.1 ComEC/Rec2 family competence protein [Shinella sp. CPCC 101442]
MAGVDEAERRNAVREAEAWRTPSDARLPATAPDDPPKRGAPLAVLRRLAGRLRHAFIPRQDTAAAWAAERQHGHFFLFVPVFLGVGAALWFAAASDPSVFALVLVACATFWPAWRLRHREDWLALAAGGAFLVPVGMLLAGIETARLDTVLLDAPVTTQITGRVLARESDERGAIRYRIVLEATREPVLKRAPRVVTVLARSRHEPIPIGGGIAGRARLSPPSGPALAGLNDFAFDAYFAGNGAVGYFYKAPERVETAAAGLEERIRQEIATWRNNLTEHIRGRIDGDAGAIAAALVTAEQRAISEETVEAMRQAGLAHVLAISGLNMVLAAGTFLVGARMLMALIPGFVEHYPAKKIAAAGALVMVTLYILVSGGAISAVRSWIMICVMLVAVLFGRAAISLRNVAISAVLILLVTPSAITNPGFQMSYAATLGLVAGYAAWRERPVRHEGRGGAIRGLGGSAGRFLGGLTLSSLIGGFSTLIYSVGHFNRIPAYGLAGNLLSMPVISAVVMPFGLAAVLLMPFGLDAIPFAIMGKGIEWMIALSAWVASWNGEIVTGRIPAVAFLLIGLGGGLVCILRTRLRHAGTLLVLLGTAIAFWPGDPVGPEVLISEDGRLVAVLRDGRVATNRVRPPDFVYAQWRRALRLGEHVKPDMRKTTGLTLEEGGAVVENAEKRKPPRRRANREKANAAMSSALDAATRQAGFICEAKAFCAAVSPSGWRIVTLEDVAFLGIACDAADLVVTQVPLRIATCRSGARLVTARHLRRTGALEIRPGADGAATNRLQASITPAIDTLDRPWSRHRLYDWRTGTYAENEAERERASEGRQGRAGDAGETAHSPQSLN